MGRHWDKPIVIAAVHCQATYQRHPKAVQERLTGSNTPVAGREQSERRRGHERPEEQGKPLVVRQVHDPLPADIKNESPDNNPILPPRPQPILMLCMLGTSDPSAACRDEEVRQCDGNDPSRPEAEERGLGSRPPGEKEHKKDEIRDAARELSQRQTPVFAAGYEKPIL
jgi:hypothetical protein